MKKNRSKDNSFNIGKMILWESVIMLIPAVIVPFYPDEVEIMSIFIIPAIISISIGLVAGYFEFSISNSNRLVVFIWFYGIILGAIPFYLYGHINPVQALFEAVSGFTTTGLSVLDVENLPHLIIFYRALLQYIGGLGFVMTMLIFVKEKDWAILYNVEGHTDRIMPGIGKTAKVIGMMYGLFLIIGTILYTIFKMPLFDSLTHAMCALSTGGFSNRLDSIGYYHSLPIEIITVILMLIGTTNFSLLLILLKGKIKDFCKASEMHIFAVIIIFSSIMLSFFLSNTYAIGKSIRLAIFNAFSALSTTGYATCAYNNWSECAIFIMIILMVIGGGMGSTAGGIKLGRICMILKNLARNIQKKLVSDRTIVLAYYHNGKEKELLEDKQIEEASTYALSYLLIYIVGTIMLTYFAHSSLLEGAFEFASSLGTVGLSIGITNANTSIICLLIEIIGMILGRLEIFVILKAFCQ